MIVDIAFFIIVLILVFAIYKLKFKNQSKQIAATQIQHIQRELKKNTQPAIQQQNTRPQWTSQPQNQQQQQEQSQSDEDDDHQNQKMTMMDRRKQLRKEQKAKLKQQKKQALQYYLKEEKQKKEKQEEEDEEKQRKQQEKRRKQEQCYQKLVEQRQKQSKQQYDKWKGTFTVQSEGRQKQSLEQQILKQQQQLKSLQKTVIKNKLSLLDDLSYRYKLSTTQLIDKIKLLESRRTIKGIFDQRGKYLSIEQKQWESIKNYIEIKGRVKKSDIMKQCAKIIKIPEENQLDVEIISLIEKENQNNLN